ncbi:MAG: ATP-binding protein, partial [Lachnospiraceae bacterium]
QLLLPALLPLTDVELCTMLGNLLENALDACRRMAPATDASPRTIRLFTKETGMLFFLCVENSYDGIVLSDKGHFLSRKRNGKRSGIGISSIREIVERHGGSVSVYPMEHLFRVGITLPMK